MDVRLRGVGERVVAWRLITDGAIDGRLNMAIDRAIQIAREEGSAPPTVRLYRWARPTVTIGRFQDLDGVDVAECDRRGVDIARRFTGGRGVLHDDELTYSVIASTDDGVPKGVAASYRVLCSALSAAYVELGVDAELTPRDRGAGTSAACYLATSRADLSLGALKLSGSAQVWLGATVLQHGSFTVTRDVEREAAAFRLGDEERARLAATTATLVGVLGRRPDDLQLERAVCKGFADALGIRLVPGELSAREAELAGTLLADKATDPYATHRVRTST